MDHVEKLENKIKEMQDKIFRLEAQREKTVLSESKQRRKERTRQLIQMGALAEKYFGFDTVAEFEDFLRDKGQR